MRRESTFSRKLCEVIPDEDSLKRIDFTFKQDRRWGTVWIVWVALYFVQADNCVGYIIFRLKLGWDVYNGRHRSEIVAAWLLQMPPQWPITAPTFCVCIWHIGLCVSAVCYKLGVAKFYDLNFTKSYMCSFIDKHYLCKIGLPNWRTKLIQPTATLQRQPEEQWHKDKKRREQGRESWTCCLTINVRCNVSPTDDANQTPLSMQHFIIITLNFIIP